jgi:hypothetical protein
MGERRSSQRLSNLRIYCEIRASERRSADRKSVAASAVLEAPDLIGGPWRTRTSDRLIKSHFRQDGIGHHRDKSAAGQTRLAGLDSACCLT